MLGIAFVLARAAGKYLGAWLGARSAGLPRQQSSLIERLVLERLEAPRSSPRRRRLPQGLDLRTLYFNRHGLGPIGELLEVN